MQKTIKPLNHYYMNLFSRSRHFPIRTIDQLKSSVSILFIDNEVFNLIDDLKVKEGWKRINYVPDISSLDQSELVDAHIVCVDIQGVGVELGFPDEGLGLIEAIHEKYPEKKLIMYSAEAQGQVDAFHPAEDIVDARLRKSANRYQFETQIERLAQEAFCVDACALNIQRVLSRELNVTLGVDEIKRILERIYSNGRFDRNSICRAFNLSNVGSIASIISLFFSL